jgi:cell division protein FtsL
MCGESITLMARALSKPGDRVLWMDRNSGIKSGSRRSESRKSRALMFAALTFVLILCCLFFVWSRIQVIQLGYEISAAVKEGRSLTEANKRLRLEIATLKSYARIEKIAVEELGMAKPRPDQVIIIR